MPISPRLADWIRQSLGHDAAALRDLGLRDSEDTEIFARGREQNAILLTKDQDFAELVIRQGPPPAVIWLRCGNTSETRLKEILTLHLHDAIHFINSGEALVEIR